jgi:A118 family predicted phage portal protein
MPLPTGNITWPPKQLATITPQIAQWAAWYSGNPDDLTSAYGGTDTAGRPLERIRPAQFSGGVVGAVARWFWGQPTADGNQRTKLHVPLASDIATASADLLFSEQPRIVTNEDEDKKSVRKERLDTILEGASWESLLPEAGEVASALTGVYLRIVWDDEIADHPLITAVHADAAWPEFRMGRLSAVTFWQIVDTHGSTVVRHLERHEPGRIEHGLYEGRANDLGRPIPLTEHPSTADLSVDADSGIATGTNRMTAVYVPNVRPNRKWRNDPVGSNLGRSDFDGIEGPMDALDETYTSWMRDVRIGKGRILVDQTALESQGRGKGASVDLDQEVFVGLNVMGEGGEGAPFRPQQFEIRAADHQATIQGLLERIISGAGYSLQTFGLANTDGGAQTATEVSARERKSMTTREKKTRYWSPALGHLLQALLEVDAAKFGGPGPFERLKVEFPPSVQPTIMELASTAQVLKTAQAASIETLVRLTHPDWDKPAVDTEVALIKDQNALTVPDMGPLPGEAGSEAPATVDSDA